MERCVRRERENIWFASRDIVPTPAGNEIIPIEGSAAYMKKKERHNKLFIWTLRHNIYPTVESFIFPKFNIRLTFLKEIWSAQHKE